MDMTRASETLRGAFADFSRASQKAANALLSMGAALHELDVVRLPPHRAQRYAELRRIGMTTQWSLRKARHGSPRMNY